MNRVSGVNINEINPEIAAMAKELLDLYSKEDLSYTCPEISALYRWATRIVQRVSLKFGLKVLPKEPKDPARRIAFREERQRDIWKMSEKQNKDN